MKYWIKLPDFFRYSFIIIIILCITIMLMLIIHTNNSSAKGSAKIDKYIYDELKIRQGTKELYFNKVTGNVWITIGNEPQRVDKESLDDLIETLSNFTFKEIISENPNKYDYYQVTDETALIICFLNHGRIADKYYIGKNNSNYNSTFIRRENDPAVYQENGQITTRFSPEKTEWVHNALPQITTDNINIIIVKFPSQNFTYTLDKNNNWLSWNGCTGNQTPLTLLDKFSNLTLSSPLTPSKSTEIIPARETYSIVFRNGEEPINTYKIYLLDNLGVYLKAEPFVYRVLSDLYKMSSANYYIKNG